MSFPSDPAIPALGAMREIGPEPLLGEAGLAGPFTLERLLRHHRGKRCTLVIAGPSGRVLFKAYRQDQSVHCLLAVMAGLNRAGLAGPVPAHVLASSQKHHFVVTEWFEGPSGRDLIESGNGRRAGELAAMWAAKVRLDARYFPGTAAAEPAMDRARRMITALDENPALAEPARNLGKKLALGARKPGGEVMCHGSFKPGHIFDLGTRPGLIDWESARIGQAELDAGTFLGKLASLGVRHPRLNPQLQDAREVFLDRTAGMLDRHLVLWYEAFAQLKRAAAASRRRSSAAEKKAQKLLEEAAVSLGAGA